MDVVSKEGENGYGVAPSSLPCGLTSGGVHVVPSVQVLFPLPSQSLGLAWPYLSLSNGTSRPSSLWRPVVAWGYSAPRTPAQSLAKVGPPPVFLLSKIH